MLENKPVNIFEDGLESRDYVYVTDIADGVVASLENDESNGQVINLGSGMDTSVIDLAHVLKKNLESRSSITITGDFRIGDIAHNKADILKAKKILGFNPKTDLVDGIRTFCEWVKGQEIFDDKYENSLDEIEHAGMLFRNDKNSQKRV